MHEAGYKIVAVSDSHGGIHSEMGIDPMSVMRYKTENGTVQGAPCMGECQNISNDELLALDVDLLIPAALENTITKDNVTDIKAKVILELANGPVTFDADEILEKAGCIVLPDILANAGGVTVSYFEWVQNKAGFYWEEEEVHERLKVIMARESQEIWNIHKDKDCDMRTAAYVHSLGRIAEAIDAHGTKAFFSH